MIFGLLSLKLLGALDFELFRLPGRLPVDPEPGPPGPPLPPLSPVGPVGLVPEPPLRIFCPAAPECLFFAGEENEAVCPEPDRTLELNTSKFKRKKTKCKDEPVGNSKLNFKS
jgi:hypothetical protein